MSSLGINGTDDTSTRASVTLSPTSTAQATAKSPNIQLIHGTHDTVGLQRIYRTPGEPTAREVARLVDAVSQVSGESIVAPEALVEELGPAEALTRVAFAWYYEEGGGDRVQNTGEQLWGGLLVGDLGKETQTKLPVVTELGKRLIVTVPLSLAAVLLSYLIALPLSSSTSHHSPQLWHSLA